MGKVSTDTFKNYLIYLFLIFEMLGTAWICGSNNHQLLRKWHLFTMTTLFATRIYSFYRKDYLLYLFEMCYVINIVSIPCVFYDIGMQYVYPFLHGPLIGYSLVYGDAFIPHDLDKTTSLAIHSFGAIVTRRLYWEGDMTKILSSDKFTFEVFLNMMKKSTGIYLLWAIPYCIFYLFPFNGNGKTMIRYVAKLKDDEFVSFSLKFKYIFFHMLYVLLFLVIGNLSMVYWQIDYLLIITQVISGFVHGGYYYLEGHKFKYTKAKNEVIKSIKNNVSVKDDGVYLKLNDTKDKTEHVVVKLGKFPKLVKIDKTNIINDIINIDNINEKKSKTD